MVKYVPWMLHNVQDYRCRDEKIRRLVGIEEIEPYLHEYFGYVELQKKIETVAKPRVSLPRILGGGFSFIIGPALYTLCRVHKPKIVVETGVSHGVSSYVILTAMSMNGQGMLYSIDLPTSIYEIPGCGITRFDLDIRKVGWIIPNRIRRRWKLFIGDARKLLRPLLEDLGEIDIFLHDSEHTYEHMMFEFVNSYPVIKKGGLLLADDINLNAAFKDFVSRVTGIETRFYTWGAIKKL